MSSVGTTHFNWLPTRSAWQELEYHRVLRAAALQDELDAVTAINSAMSAALQNNISGSATNAAQAALKRVQAAAKAKNAETTKNIDQAQKLIDNTKASLGADASANTTSTNKTA